MLLNDKYHIEIIDTAIVGTENIRVVLSIDYDKTGSSAYSSISGATYGIFLRGDLVITEKFDLEEFWLAQGETSIEFIDRDQELTTILFSDDTDLNTLYISIYRDADLLFRGFIDQTAVSCNPLSQSVKLNFRPRNYLLNETDTYVGSNINTAPLGVDFDIDYNFGNPADPDNDYNLVSDVITRIFNIPPLPPDIGSSDLTVDISQNWKYKTVIGGTPPTELQIKFPSLYVLNRYLFGRYDGLGIWTPNSYTNYGQLLKALAFDFGCFAGYLSDSKAVFLQFTEVFNSRVYEVSEEQLFDHSKEISRGMLQYLKLVADSTIFAGVGTPTNIQSKYLEYRIYANIYRLEDAGKYWNISYYLPADESYELTKEYFLADYWSAYFFRAKQQYEATFELSGTDLDLTRQIKYKGEYFQPTEIRRNLTQNTTSVSAIYL